MSKSSVWFEMTARIQVPKGPASATLKRLSARIGTALQEEYGEDLKGWDMGVDDDPSHMLEGTLPKVTDTTRPTKEKHQAMVSELADCLKSMMVEAGGEPYENTDSNNADGIKIENASMHLWRRAEAILAEAMKNLARK
jgi:hypothetical protein